MPRKSRKEHEQLAGVKDLIIHDASQRCWQRFSDPKAVYSTTRLEEVVSLLQKVEKKVEKEKMHAVGFVGYEAAPAFDPALTVRSEPGEFPLAWFALYGEPETLPEEELEKSGNLDAVQWNPSMTREHYVNSIARIKDYIQTGHTYQVNFTLRMDADFDGESRQIFAGMIEAQKGLYGAMIETEDWAICSASPELFFTLDGDLLESKPMKGTAARGKTHDDDQLQGQALQESAKNRAENVMIVDMVRNDMGRIADAGTVEVTSLFDVEKFPTLWQMTSTVQCKTKASVAEIFKALFPAASITGAPKASTMRIIAELEDRPRRIYTGTIGFMAPGRKAQFNVAIRTVLVDLKRAKAEYGVGGGIVWDSVDSDEYAECCTKSTILTRKELPEFSILESLLWTPEDGYYLFNPHMVRMAKSMKYFHFPLTLEDVQGVLMALSAQLRPCPHKVRILVSRMGQVRCQVVPIEVEAAAPVMRVCLASGPVNSADLFLYHKTTHREVYEQARKSAPDFDDVLLWNENGELTEFCSANLVMEMQGKLFTPPVQCGLLAGTYRAKLLNDGKIEERVLTREDLARCEKIYWVNSVRKMREAWMEK